MPTEPNPKYLMLPIGAAAKELGVSVKTLQRWDQSGVLVAVRLPSGHRRYRREDLDALKATA